MPDMIVEPPYEVQLFANGMAGNLQPIKMYPNGGRQGMTPDEVAVWEYVKALRLNQSAGRRVAVLYYPPGDTDNGDGPRSNQAIAKEIVEVLTKPGADANPNFVAGVILARVPADAAANWIWVPPHVVDEVIVREGVTPEVQAPAPASIPQTPPAGPGPGADVPLEPAFVADAPPAEVPSRGRPNTGRRRG